MLACIIISAHARRRLLATAVRRPSGTSAHTRTRSSSTALLLPFRFSCFQRHAGVAMRGAAMLGARSCRYRTCVATPRRSSHRRAQLVSEAVKSSSRALSANRAAQALERAIRLQAAAVRLIHITLYPRPEGRLKLRPRTAARCGRCGRKKLALANPPRPPWLPHCVCRATDNK